MNSLKKSSKPGRSHGNIIQLNEARSDENNGQNAYGDSAAELSVDTALEVDR